MVYAKIQGAFKAILSRKSLKIPDLSDHLFIYSINYAFIGLCIRISPFGQMRFNNRKAVKDFISSAYFYPFCLLAKPVCITLNYWQLVQRPLIVLFACGLLRCASNENLKPVLISFGKSLLTILKLHFGNISQNFLSQLSYPYEIRLHQSFKITTWNIRNTGALSVHSE